MKEKSAEILAPAGDAAAFEAALTAGADAIYLGLQEFSARKAAANFTAESLQEYIRRAHVLGAKVYVALNTLIKESERWNFYDKALRAWNVGADALIVQDLFLGRQLKECYPEMELHLSTQAGVCNTEGARYAKEFGFSRVILARETPLTDIARIAQIIETECFVQGALCTCFSGQCYFSSVVGGNSGNRGFCKQPCRKQYAIDRAGFDKEAYRLSLSDLCVGQEIEKLRQAGVSSFKIEGRMRSAAYVAAAVRYYRDILDGKEERLADDLSALKRTFNRGNYTKGYLFGQDKNLISSDIQGHIGEPIGKIADADKSGRYVYVRSAFEANDKDGFKIIRKGKEEIGGAVWRKGYPTAKGGFYLPFDEKYRKGDTVCVTTDTSLTKRMQELRRTVALDLSVWIQAGQPMRASVKCGGIEYVAESTTVAEPSRGRPITEQEIVACFSKVDEFPFYVRCGQIIADGASFVVRSQLNAFRRQVFADVYALLGAGHAVLESRKISLPEMSPSERGGAQIAVIDRDFTSPCYRKQILDYAIYDPKDCRNERSFADFFTYAKYYAKHKYIYLPAYCSEEDLCRYQKYIPFFDGVYADGYYALSLCRKMKTPCFAGTGLNLFNRADVLGVLAEGAQALALSKELSLSEISEIDLPSAFVFAGGRTRIMDLGHCPFGKSCSACDHREQYELRDEGGRIFPLLRGQRSDCRFSVYNCVPLFFAYGGNRLLDFSASSEEEKECLLCGAEVGNCTAGASKRGVR